MRLGVNIDHVATVREARKTNEPDPIKAALISRDAGADQITFHLREDRRHIQDEDVRKLRAVITEIPLNMEMAPTEEMKNIAKNIKPDRITLVPEKRQEITTEGGLDVISLKDYLRDFVKEVKECGIDVAVNEIELHTGEYANSKDIEKTRFELERVRSSAKFGRELGLKVYAGHGLTYLNVKPIAKIKEIEELNIGHSIIANSIFMGLEEAVRKMKKLINEAREDF